ncbi:NAD-dependent epimerase/dehydratase family protein [Hydrogenovibrio thermophilus]|uniref:NAD(P)-dependent oxidoreductase n=1 Tax=Hydrogenovibrio thermophilus TaxID=265883 RepID=A0A410H4E2_9GAMM|nr:NAD(P)-dependent oxidoreductase [Hydrogenovibrio thermophilus]QAB15789.1 NAD(P)-dependent oxidoreductase [Hydrogenovibrio thermophilus]
MSKPTVLLTGATGFLGSHLLEALIQQGYSVVVLKRTASSLWRIEHLAGQYKSYDVDVQSISKIFEHEIIDIVIHMATLYRKFDNGNEVSEMLASNVTFPAEIVEAASRKGIKGFINTGTFFEYDCSRQPVDESTSIAPFNFYAKTKLAFESILKTHSDKMMVNTFRLFSPYGEKDNQKLVPMIIQKALEGEVIELSEGLQKIDLIYVKDIVSAYMKAVERISSGTFPPEYEVFNLGSGVPLSIRDIVSIVEQKVGKPLKKTWGEASKIDIPIAYADITKLERILHWKPEYTALQGIENTVSFYQKEGMK